MKKTKIVIPALGLLLLSTAASVTSTVAWFASNEVVTASSMSIEAKVGANLFIKEGAGVALGSLLDTNATLTNNGGNEVDPANMSNTSGTVTVQFPATWTTAPTVSTVGVPATYSNVGTLTASAATGTPGTHCAYSFVTIARKQSATGGKYDLTASCNVTFATASELNKSLRCGVIMDGQWIVSGDNGVNTATGEGEPTTFTFANTLEGSAGEGLTDNTAYSACLVIWYDGNDSDCITNNAINLGANSASWSFTAADHEE